MAGDQQSFTQWHTGSPETGQTSVSSTVLGPEPYFRNEKDRLITRWGQSPDTQHPDGYLGTMEGTRRQDKLLSAVHRQNHRSYSRGVHKGERINPGDYLWPDEFNPETGMQIQMATATPIANGWVVSRQPPAGDAPTPHLVNGGKSLMHLGLGII